ncbi:MAG: HAMP domain-containing histidine kinase [Anaerolineales bacterium]|nr:HAMP domain-containing histidine kinase [Anaerolineales bacterium]MCX7753931.1 HAMP domain-containing histidine kinase [Anaerolineales bacterium]MDW8278010.1 HAMP domain-containing sensor histidine kinase [Anaerolineales bacterium]
MSKTPLHLPDDLDLVEFISKEAHDLKSPFNRILGFTKMLLKGMSGPLTDMQKDDLTVVYENSAQAMTAMSNLVDMARLSRGEKAFSVSETNLNNILAQTVAYWKQNKAVKDVELVTHFPEGETRIRADETLLRQGLLNWILYVVEYTQPPAQVMLTLEPREQDALVTVQSRGKRNPAAGEMFLTMSAYIGQTILKMHQGAILTAEGDEEGAVIRLSLPKA